MSFSIFRYRSGSRRRIALAILLLSIMISIRAPPSSGGNGQGNPVSWEQPPVLSGTDEMYLTMNDPRPLQAIPTYEQSKEAARIIDIAMAATKEYLQLAYTENITERMVIDEIVRVIEENGADPYVSAFWSASTDPDPSAGLIVCSGPDTAKPHGNYDDDEWKQIMPGEVVVVDIGARYQGRCSDETRTFFMGEPTETQRKVYGIVKEAHELSSAAIDQFVQVRELDKLARDHITDNGYGDEFTHSLGHGVGYYIHEPPLITQTAPAGDQPLRLWDVITIEPGIYIENETKGGGDIFGIRIENDYGVSLGGPELLTFHPIDIEEMIVHPPDDYGGDDDNDSGFIGSAGSAGSVGIMIILLLAIPATVWYIRKQGNEQVPGDEDAYEPFDSDFETTENETGTEE